jgi:D-aminopeptidase
MRVVLSADMEGVSQLREVREIAAACAEYWETGKLRYEADVVAACEGLLSGGATEVVVLDNTAAAIRPT